MADTSNRSCKPRGALKRRSRKACQSCRKTKTKCERVGDEPQCRRCLATSTSCFFPASRRGRIRGSKNRRTLEKLHDEQLSSIAVSGAGVPSLEDATGTSDEDASPDSMFEGSGTIEVPPCDSQTANAHSQPGAGSHGASRGPRLPNYHTRLQTDAMQSGTCTPWNPQNIVMNEGSHRSTLTRKLLQILGEFPIEDDRSDDGSTKTNGLQDPLWLTAGLAERGWDLKGKQGGRKRVRHSNPLVSTDLPAEDACLLSKWTTQALQEIEKEESAYWKHGVLGSKLDVAQDLDPIQHGLVSEKRARELLRVYWERVHPQWAMLDPSLHTLDYVRTRSAFLTTTLLAIGATALASNPLRGDEQVSEALRLHAHTEKLNLVVYATSARSIDIIQAQILLCRWGVTPKTRLDEQRWIRAGMIPRMASEIGLNLPRRYDNSNLDAEKAEKLRRNDLRTRAFMVVNEYRFFTYSGRPPMELSHFELSDSELEEIDRLSRKESPPSLATFYRVFLLDRDVRQRLEQYQPGPKSSLSLHAELEHIKVYFERLIQEWCPRDGDPRLNWHLTHEILSTWLLLAVRIGRRRSTAPDATMTSQQEQEQHQQQQLLLNLSLRLFQESLKVPEAVFTTSRAAIFSFAASIILRLSTRRDIVLRAALRMAGEPGRPYVPTFVRDSGNQILVMLWSTNNLVSGQQAEDESIHESRAGSQDENSSFPPDPSPQSVDDIVQGQPTMMRSDESLHDLQSFHAPETPFGTQTNAENLFSFNVNDFPCVPDPTQPQIQPEDGMFSYPCVYPNGDLDAWIGQTLSRTFTNTARSTQNGQGLDTGSADRYPFYDTGLGLSMDAMAGQRPVPLDGSSWSLNNLSPNHPFTNGGANEVSDRTAQREVLIAAVDRLVQLASLMQ